jgi:hypothetical protein
MSMPGILKFIFLMGGDPPEEEWVSYRKRGYMRTLASDEGWI